MRNTRMLTALLAVSLIGNIVMGTIVLGSGLGEKTQAYVHCLERKIALFTAGAASDEIRFQCGDRF